MMKIGEFSKKYDLTPDTVRYYISEGLLIPKKIHNQYYFDEKSEIQIKEILELKKLKFTISEMKKLISFNRINEILSDDQIYLDDFLVQKEKELNEEKEKIENALKVIKEKKKQMSSLKKKKFKYGVPVNVINNFYCPTCKKTLKINTSQIIDSSIFDGFLECECGYKVEISEGIIKAPGFDNFGVDRIKEYDENTKLKKYNSEITPYFSAFFKKLYEYNINYVKDDYNEILEFEYGDINFLKYFDDNKKKKVNYYLYNKSYPAISFVKKKIEKSELVLNPIFMCGDFDALPFRDNFFDIIFDITGSINYLSFLREPNFSEYNRVLKDEHYCIIHSLFYDEWAQTLKSKKINPNYYKLEYFKDFFFKSKFNLFKQYDIGSMKKASSYVTVHVDGDEVYFKNFVFKK